MLKLELARDEALLLFINLSATESLLLLPGMGISDEVEFDKASEVWVEIDGDALFCGKGGINSDASAPMNRSAIDKRGASIFAGAEGLRDLCCCCCCCTYRWDTVDTDFDLFPLCALVEEVDATGFTVVVAGTMADDIFSDCLLNDDLFLDLPAVFPIDPPEARLVCGWVATITKIYSITKRKSIKYKKERKIEQERKEEVQKRGCASFNSLLISSFMKE